MKIPKQKLIAEARKHGYCDLFQTPQNLSSVKEWMDKLSGESRISHQYIAAQITNYFAIKLAREVIKCRKKK